ncbi:glycerate dehydrogenase [Colletotrichum truncatum]|uniref:Glycerate dehydrogenase n=1 Tax=Colletotrichum truncatum TaxID=5467 RepID=A0ACC3Z6F0_COLTU|nr:glycerate dehydrogenase [Colletotrichum truncatum]KAF6788067.1 glycerate dehydrogenase [Colletotrichum truncatum]
MADDPATEVKSAVRLPSATHHVIVKLETIHVSLPEIDTGDLTHEVIGYKYTRPTDTAVAAARVRPASILITTTVPITAETLGEAPYLKCVITETTGTNHIDLEECERRGVTVMYSPNATAEAVSEHAIGFYFSTRRRLVKLHNTMMDHSPSRANAWRATGSMSSLLLDSEGRPPHTCGNEVVGMLGYGPIGQKIAKMCKALGMEVLVAARKSAPSPSSSSPPTSALVNGNGDAERTPFEEVIRRATTLFLVVPLTPETKNLIGEEELRMMRPDVVIVNVGRGGTIDEKALLSALAENRIYGAATDVYEVEPAGSGEDSVLLGDEARGLNLTLTPHLAWCADQTRVNIRRVVGENLRGFVRGEKGANVVLDMRK